MKNVSKCTWEGYNTHIERRLGFVGKRALLCACFMALSSVISCGDDGDSSNKNSNGDSTKSVSNKTISGVSQKGPFVVGSTVTVQELNGDSLLQTGNSFIGQISNDHGEFSVASVTLASQYVFMKVNGYYRNEVSGKNSESPIILNALTDISERDNVNVNLLTHLETERVMHLVTVDGKKFGDAKKQARDELMQVFGFAGSFGDAEDMNIFGTGDGAAALLAISVVSQGHLAAGDFSERIARISSDFADGTIDNQEVWTQMARWAMTADLQKIRQNMEKWGEQVPDFEKYVKTFWKEKLGLATCENIGEIAEKYETILTCRTDGWDAATYDEVLTYCLGSVCNKDNEGEFKNFFVKDKDWTANCNFEGIYRCCNDQWTTWKWEEFIEYYSKENLGECNDTNKGEIKHFDGAAAGLPDGYEESRDFQCNGESWVDWIDPYLTANYTLGECNDENKGEIKHFDATAAGLPDGYEYDFLCNGDSWGEIDYILAIKYYYGECNDEKLGEVKELSINNGNGKGTLYYYYTCRGYGSERRWEESSQEEIVASWGTCQPEDGMKVNNYGCFVCKDSQWSSEDYAVLEYVLGPCSYNGEIKKYESSSCGWWANGQYVICKSGYWGWVEGLPGEIPPGNCSEVGAKRRMDGVCYVCGTSKKWEVTACE